MADKKQKYLVKLVKGRRISIPVDVCNEIEIDVGEYLSITPEKSGELRITKVNL
ncbi:hypothetical protein [Candidatus Methanomassiliicoccus intestinalis]|uniref:hypothetical protein n=1 Tax=Candidatus Methanomassiliicoccus intestinalis TaxID=1406512 RepID=UPI0037DD70F8